MSADWNFDFAAALMDALAAAGVRDAVVSPGSRSAPLTIAAARHPRLRCWTQIDERSGGFFALGLAKASRAPVALVCTSGTAATNYHPAVVEACHARVPLIVLTADRPPELRDCGAGQTIDQVELYGSAARWFVETPIPGPGDDAASAARELAREAVACAASRPRGPVHLNVPFREPLAPSAAWAGRAASASADAPLDLASPRSVIDSAQATSLAERMEGCKKGLLICGPLDDGDETTDALLRLARALGWPLLADGASQLRTTPESEAAPLVTSYDLFLRDGAFGDAHAPDFVLRFGDTPTSKALRLWLERHRPPSTVLIDPDGVGHDPSRLATDVLRVTPLALCRALREQIGDRDAPRTAWCADFLAAEAAASLAVARVLEGTDVLLEARVVPELVHALPDGALLYVSNSMPIRDLDAFLRAGPKRLRVLCNRGANGIDGVTSSALGAAAAGAGPVTLLTGDLAFLHDAGALLPAHSEGLRATLVVLDNDGGGIFSFLPVAERGDDVDFEARFRTPHGVDLAALAQAWKARAIRISSWEHLRTELKEASNRDGVQVLVVPVDRDRNVAQHREIAHAVAEAVTP